MVMHGLWRLMMGHFLITRYHFYFAKHREYDMTFIDSASSVRICFKSLRESLELAIAQSKI
jgi:hypothetical protein